jgi:hypothetical protein
MGNRPSIPEESVAPKWRYHKCMSPQTIEVARRLTYHAGGATCMYGRVGLQCRKCGHRKCNEECWDIGPDGQRVKILPAEPTSVDRFILL